MNTYNHYRANRKAAALKPASPINEINKLLWQHADRCFMNHLGLEGRKFLEQQTNVSIEAAWDADEEFYICINGERIDSPFSCQYDAELSLQTHFPKIWVKMTSPVVVVDVPNDRTIDYW